MDETLGILIGSVVGGTLGDKFGRKLIMMLAAFITCPIMLGSGFIPNYGGEHVSIFHRGCFIFHFIHNMFLYIYLCYEGNFLCTY